MYPDWETDWLSAAVPFPSLSASLPLGMLSATATRCPPRATSNKTHQGPTRLQPA